MGSFTVTGPDGKKAKINFPDGTTPDQLQGKIDQVKTSWGGGGRAWSDIPSEAASNLGSSATRFVENVTYPIRHPIDTAKGLFDIGWGGASKLDQAIGNPTGRTPERIQEDEAQIDAVGSFFKDRYGSGEGVKKTLATDPVGVAADAAAVLTGGGAIAAKVPGLARPGAALKSAANYVDPIAVAGKAIAGGANLTGKAAAAILGTTTGAGSLPIETAYQAGKAGSQVFRDNIRGDAPLSDALDMGQSALRAIRKDRGDAYTAGMSNVKANNTVLDFEPIIDSVIDAHGMVAYKGLPKSDAAAATYHKIRQIVSQVRDLPKNEYHTAEGFDAIKQAIGEIKLAAKPGTLEHKIAGQVYNAVKAQIVKQAPEYAKAMKDYSGASSQIEEMTKALSLGDRASKDTAMRKLTSVMRNNVNTNYGHRQKLVDELAKKQPELPNALAGQALNSWTPRGLQGLAASGAGISSVVSNPAGLAMLPAFSPRVAGEAAYTAGRVGNALSGASRFTPPQAYRNALYAAGLLNQDGE